MKLTGDKWNLANFLSYSRIILIPLFIYLLAVNDLMLALIVFAIASITDFFDGWVARRFNQESEFGKFIDPIADKFLVIASLIAIIWLDPYFRGYDSWMIVVIAGRDVLITVMRWLAIRKGRSLRTSRFGKFKTAFQMISIVLILMIYMERKFHLFDTHVSVPYWIMLAVTIMTALSGVRYIVTNWQLFFPEKEKSDEQAAK
ncbi:MAG TPA: CDP-diacylglycerol--glycerol-3-phosphate 3-phosphatidyltransferase [Spirochaetota bacterium]|nr:CDP-diacylglycerol--glycerol-3-phosphate 3-phosphatidyltransferase [Spirochaetota bacterium]